MPTISDEYKGRPLSELRKMCKRVDSMSEVSAKTLAQFNCYCSANPSYACSNYQILSEPHKMTDEEWIELVDGGGFNFGGRRCGNTVTVYID